MSGIGLVGSEIGVIVCEANTHVRPDHSLKALCDGVIKTTQSPFKREGKKMKLKEKNNSPAL